MTRLKTARDLRPSEATFMTAMRHLCFGRFEFLQIRNGQLVLNPWPTAVRAVKFASVASPSESRGADPTLPPQIVEFFEYVRDVDAGEIRELEVRHGLPFSMEIEMVGARREGMEAISNA